MKTSTTMNVVINKQQEEATPIDAGFLIRAIYNEVDRRAELPDNDPKKHAGYTSAVYRPRVYIADKNNTFVTKLEQLLELVSDVTQIQHETTYCGYDSEEVMVLRLGIPQGYQARVPYVQVKHIPLKFSIPDGVVLKKMPPKYSEKTKTSIPSDWVLLCRELSPIYTNRRLFEIPEEEIRKTYHFFTMKVRKSDHTLKSWFPGRDINCSVCPSLEDMFVLVGEHFDRTATKSTKQDADWQAFLKWKEAQKQ
jgi:hypothetical protein